MMIDVDHQISSVERTVGERVLEAGTARVLTVSQSYGGIADDLWDACTSAERIARWFMPVSGDLRPGGRYQLEGNASGTVERWDPPRSFSATWEYGDEVSWIEVRLEPEAAERTRLVLVVGGGGADGDGGGAHGPHAPVADPSRPMTKRSTRYKIRSCSTSAACACSARWPPAGPSPPPPRR